MRKDTELTEPTYTGRAGRPRGTGSKQRPVADVDKTLEESAWVIQRFVARVAALQNGAQPESQEVSPQDLDAVTKALRALADVQGIVEESAGRLRRKLDGMTDEELYEKCLAQCNELGAKLGRRKLVESE